MIFFVMPDAILFIEMNENLILIMQMRKWCFVMLEKGITLYFCICFSQSPFPRLVVALNEQQLGQKSAVSFYLGFCYEFLDLFLTRRQRPVEIQFKIEHGIFTDNNWYINCIESSISPFCWPIHLVYISTNEQGWLNW